eukprot:CAMPEP_0183500890 /NCGR_PEP_ID=MMETSP0371-20130417/2941_1 /TAXON_ID=268820 /ORGANISM="Peridinium aciculiferum, Strain PAER-2" /LENGTH=76 /DNA_ID=CAMNT_0025695133 /DNA_START=28 /DNA_END=255 /DNA_ORIENTATION=-
MSEKFGVRRSPSFRANTAWSPFSCAVSRTAAATFCVRLSMRLSLYILSTRVAPSFCVGLNVREPILAWASGCCSRI